MTKREVEEYLVHLAPKPAVSPGARQRPATSPSPAAGKAGSIEPCQPGIYNLRFAADKAFMDKLQRAAEVSGVGHAGRDMARVLERALEAYLEKNDPRKRQERRAKRATQRALAEAGTVTAEAVAGDDAHRTKARSRAIPTSVRDRLLIRAGHRCEYRGSDGLRCSERSRLEIDHIVPWGLGGTSRAENLRVLCCAHNRLHADRCFGAEFMDHKIESARSMSARVGAGGYQPPRPDEAMFPSWVREPAEVYRAGHRLSCAGPRQPMCTAMVLAD